MGNLRSVYKALEHVGAEPELTVRPRPRARGRRDRAARRGRDAEGDGARARAGARRAAARARGRRRAGDRPLHGHAAAVRVHDRAGRRRGHRPAGGAGRAARRARRSRRSAGTPVSWKRASVLNDGLPDPCAFYHANSFAPAPGARRGRARAPPSTAASSSSVVERPPVYGLQSHPEKSGPDGLRLLANFARLAQRMILLPAVDIRDGKAVRLRQGHFDDETVYADDPLEAARSFVEAGARFLHVVDLDGAREGEPVNLHHVERIARELEVPVELRRRPALDRLDPARAEGRERRAWCSAPPRSPTPTCSTRRWPPSPRACWWGWTCAAARCRCRAGRARPRCAARTRSGCMQQRGVTRFVYTNVDRDGMLEGPDLDEVRRVGEAVRGRFLYSGGIGVARRPGGAARPAAGEPGRRDLRQGALRGALRRRRGPGGAGGLMLLRRVIPCLDVDKGRVVKGVEFVEPARRRRPGRAGRALPGRGRRRDRLPRHHRLARAARDRRRAGPPLRRRRVHPVHDRRRRALGRRTPRRCSTRAPTRCR